MINLKWVLLIVIFPICVILSYQIAIANSEGDLTSIIGMTVVLSYIALRQLLKLLNRKK